MSNSEILELPYLEAAQAQKHVTYNEAIEKLDVLIQLTVSSKSRIAPPENPTAGAIFIVGKNPEGYWAGHDNDLAIWRFNSWTFIQPKFGWRAWIVSDQVLMVFTEQGWNTISGPQSGKIAQSPYGAEIRFEIAEEEIICMGNSVQSDIAIPNRAILFGVSTRTINAITGAGSYHCGLLGEESKFGGFLGVGAGSSNAGVIAPTAFYVDTPVVVSAIGSAFTGGSVRISIHYGMFTVAES